LGIFKGGRMASTPTKVLLVDDDPDAQDIMQIYLGQWGFQVRIASNGTEARDLADTYNPDIVISDVVMPELSGLELLRCLQSSDPGRPVILITGYSSVDMAVEAMKEGAQDFLTKPLDYSKLKSILEAARIDLKVRKESQELSTQLERGAGFGPLVGKSRVMKELYKLIKTVAGSEAPVIISGESGTGKELVARSLHDQSARSKEPFIAVNSAAIPQDLIESEIFGHEKGAFTGAIAEHPGCFELSNRGTLLLDEIAEMPILLQSKLLRVLEGSKIRRLGGVKEFSVDVRVIASTNQNPRHAVESGNLREDLYFRLNVFSLLVPPLREHKDDVPLLAQYFIQQFNQKHSLHVEALREGALKMLKAYSWPGNVRELKNAMERAVIMARGNWIETSHLPPYIQNPVAEDTSSFVLPLGVSAARAQKELILRTLKKAGNNKAEAARQLGLDVKTILKKLKSYGVH